MTSDAVISQLAAIREGGWCNMLDRGCVLDMARQIDFPELVAFCEDATNREYMDALETMGAQR